MKIKVENLKELRKNFSRAPKLAAQYLSQAVAAAIFEVDKQAIDPNFQFKTPRSERSGLLQASFSEGKVIRGLYGAIGPVKFYSPYVYFGTKFIKANPFMDRIAKASEDPVGKHFERAIELFVGDLAKT